MSKRQKIEPQFSTANGWRVDRRRGAATQHGYEVAFRGQYVGWISRAPDGWRWHLSWSPGTKNRPPRFSLDRASTRAYPRWQTAVVQLSRTDVGRHIAGTTSPAGFEWHQHYSVTGPPWEPKPGPPPDS